MTEHSITSSWTPKKEQLPNPEYYCIHCSIPFQADCCSQNDDDEDCRKYFVERVSEIPSSSLSKLPLSQVLSTIFKLNYLKSFTTTTTTTTLEQQQQDDYAEEEKLLSLCVDCSQVLTDLYQLYDSFTQLGKLDSYLSNKLGQLNQIMEHHQERSIYCDLKEGLTVKDIKGNDDDQSQDFYSNDSAVLDKVVDNPNDCSSAAAEATTTTTTNFEREPRILLTRLSEKYLQVPPPTSSTDRQEEEEESLFSDDDCVSPPDDNDDDEYTLPESVVIKMENDEDEEEEVIKITPRVSRSGRPLRRRHPKSSDYSDSDYYTVSRDDDAFIDDDDDSENEYDEEDGRVTKSKKKSRKTTKTAKSRRPKSPKKEQKSKSKSAAETMREKYKRHRIDKVYRRKKFKKPNPCWHCNEEDFATPADCLQHTKEVHYRPGDCLCEVCSRICPTKFSFAQHKKQCESLKPGQTLSGFPCGQCPKVFPVRYYLLAHMKSHNETTFQCDKCEFTTKNEFSFKSHQTRMHTDQIQEQVQCTDPACGKLFRNKHNMKMHYVKMHTQEGHQRYREQQRVLLLRQKEERKAAISKKSTICEFCNVDCLNNLALVFHKRKFHPTDLEKTFKFLCDLCSKGFARAATLRHHIEFVHSDQRPFVCEYCAKGFKTAPNLKDHIRRTHTEEGRLEYNMLMKIHNRRRKLRDQAIAATKTTGVAENLEYDVVVHDGDTVQNWDSENAGQPATSLTGNTNPVINTSFEIITQPVLYFAPQR